MIAGYRSADHTTRCVASLFVLGLLIPGSAHPESLSIKLDRSKSTIEYSLGAVAHTVHGAFQLKSGLVEVSTASRTVSGLIVVDASSGTSGSEGRDNRMKNNILEVDRYPEITFAPTSFEGDASLISSPIKVTGWFGIHGNRHQISIPFQVKKTGEQFTATGKFVVPYVAWGMKNPSTFLLRVSEQVDVLVTAVAALASAPKP